MYIIYYMILVITSLIVIIYDYKYKEIPWILLIVNYSSICMLITPYMLLGNILIFIIKKYDKSIDWLYILIILYLIIVNPYMIFNALAILVIVSYIIFSRDIKYISMMVPLSIAILFLISLETFLI